MSQRRIPVVKVKWEDAFSAGSNWSLWGQTKELSTPVKAESVGYLVVKNSRCITLAQSLTSTGKVSDTITIPRKTVLSIEVISQSTQPKD